jgi:hypothetical protein
VESREGAQVGGEPPPQGGGLARLTHHPWFGLLGFAVGLLGLVATIYAYYATRRVRAITFLADPNPVVLVASENLRDAPFTVVRRDGRPIQDTVIAIRFFVWNSGSEPIFDHEILEPITLRLASADRTSTEILDFKLTRITRPVTRIRLIPGSKSPNELQFSFRILEPEDGATGQIIVAGPRSSLLRVGGSIVGIRHLSLSNFHPYDFPLTYFGLLFVMPAVLAISALSVARKLGYPLPPFWLFMLETVALMTLFGALGYYLASFLDSTGAIPTSLIS